MSVSDCTRSSLSFAMRNLSLIPPPSGRLKPATPNIEPPPLAEIGGHCEKVPDQEQDQDSPRVVVKKNVSDKDREIAKAITQAVANRPIPQQLLPESHPMLEYDFQDTEYLRIKNIIDAAATNERPPPSGRLLPINTKPRIFERFQRNPLNLRDIVKVNEITKAVSKRTIPIKLLPRSYDMLAYDFQNSGYLKEKARCEKINSEQKSQ